MPRIKGFNGEKEILNLLADGKPRSMRQIQRELGRHWYTIYFHLKEKENNLVKRGCVVPLKTVGEQLHVPQDEHLYKITDKGLRGCPE